MTKNRKWFVGILIIALIFILIFMCLRSQNGLISDKTKKNIILNRDLVYGDSISAELLDIDYVDGWLTGNINIYDDSMSEYFIEDVSEHNNIAEDLSSLYDLTIKINDREEKLAGDSCGYTIKDTGSSYYTESFKHYIEDNRKDMSIQIYVYGIEEPLEFMIKQK